MGDCVQAEVENRGGKDSIGSAILQDVDEMIEVAGATRGNYGDFDSFTDAAVELQVVAGLAAVAVHAREENLTGTEGDSFTCPFECVEFSRSTSAVGVHAPVVGVGLFFSVDGDDDALIAEDFSSL